MIGHDRQRRVGQRVRPCRAHESVARNQPRIRQQTGGCCPARRERIAGRALRDHEPDRSDDIDALEHDAQRDPWRHARRLVELGRRREPYDIRRDGAQPCREQHENGDDVGRHRRIDALRIGLAHHAEEERRPRGLEGAHEQLQGQSEARANRVQTDVVKRAEGIEEIAIGEADDLMRNAVGNARQPEAAALRAGSGVRTPAESTARTSG